MSVFGSIVSAIFGSPHATNVTAAAGPATTPPSTAPSPAKPSEGLAPAKPISQADLQGILEKLAAESEREARLESVNRRSDEVAEIGL